MFIRLDEKLVGGNEKLASCNDKLAGCNEKLASRNEKPVWLVGSLKHQYIKTYF